MPPWGSPGQPLRPSWTRGLCFGWGSPWGPHRPLLLLEPGQGCEGEAGALAACLGAGILSPCPVVRGAHCLPGLSPGQSGRPDPISRRPWSWGSLLWPSWPLNWAWRRPPTSCHLPGSQVGLSLVTLRAGLSSEWTWGCRAPATPAQWTEDIPWLRGALRASASSESRTPPNEPCPVCAASVSLSVKWAVVVPSRGRCVTGLARGVQEMLLFIPDDLGWWGALQGVALPGPPGVSCFMGAAGRRNPRPGSEGSRHRGWCAWVGLARDTAGGAAPWRGSECLVFQERPRQTLGRARGVGSERLQCRFWGWGSKDVSIFIMALARAEDAFENLIFTARSWGKNVAISWPDGGGGPAWNPCISRSRCSHESVCFSVIRKTRLFSKDWSGCCPAPFTEGLPGQCCWAHRWSPGACLVAGEPPPPPHPRRPWGPGSSSCPAEDASEVPTGQRRAVQRARPCVPQQRPGWREACGH